MNKKAKRRKIIADKWVFYGNKWSPYENGSGSELGVTEYAGGHSWFKSELRRNLSNMVDVFRLPLGKTSK